MYDMQVTLPLMGRGFSPSLEMESHFVMPLLGFNLVRQYDLPAHGQKIPCVKKTGMDPTPIKGGEGLAVDYAFVVVFMKCRKRKKEQGKKS